MVLEQGQSGRGSVAAMVVGLEDGIKNPILQQGKSLYETPEKVVAKKENMQDNPDEKVSQAPAAKKLCSVMEKFLKKAPGNTSLVREA